MNPVRLSDGTLFRSESAAAWHFKVNVSTIGYHLDRGTLDQLVPGGRPATFSKVPCSFDGVDYASVGDAARALGISPQAVSARLKWARKRAAAARALGVALEEMSKNSRSMPQVRPCTYDGADLPSMMAAAQAAGMQPAAFRKHLLRCARLIELVKKTFGYWPTEDGGMPAGQMAERMAAE